MDEFYSMFICRVLENKYGTNQKFRKEVIGNE